MSTSSTQTSEIRLEAVNAYWGTKHCRKITTVADSLGSLADTYFDLNGVKTAATSSDAFFSEFQGYLYFDTDPVIAGKTGLVVARTDDDSAEVIAAAIKTAIDGDSTFSALFDVKVEGAEVTIEDKVINKITAETDSGATGFTFEVLREGIGEYDGLGKTQQGGTTLTFEAQTVELKSDQTGEIILGDAYVGASVGAELPLIEVSQERISTLLGSVTGDTLTPSGGTEVVGVGQSKLYVNLVNISGNLILHPIEKDSNDHSRDWILHKSAPLPQDINFSGQDQQVLNVSFKSYLDESVNAKVNLAAFGDWTQDLS